MAWLERIRQTRSHDELLALTREYLASWKKDEWSGIPAGCRPVLIYGIEDLAFWHTRLTDGYCDVASGACEGSPVRRMQRFFERALDHAAELEGVPSVRDYYTALRLFSQRRVPRLFGAP